MNREIEFRFWHYKSKQMLYGHFAYSGKKIVITILKEDGITLHTSEPVDREEIEIMQFTGLKDSKNQEIYEGDIVGIEIDLPDKGYGFQFLEVIFEDGMWKLAVEKGSYWLNEITAKKMNVFGNVFENKDLLKEAK